MNALKKVFQSTWIILGIIILLSFPVILPYLHPGYFPTHDGEWAVVRLAEMFRELRDHQFPARYSGYLNNGYGYPLFNFAYPGPYYLGIPFVLLKLGFVNTIKLLFAVSVVLSAVGMYFASAKLWENKLAGLVSAIFYLYLPYRFVDLFVRGSLGEIMAFAVVPWVIWGILHIKEQKRTYFWIGLTSLLIGLLILVHNIMALIFAPIIVMFAVTQLVPFNKRLVFYYGLTILSGFGVAAFFWIPAILEKNNILLSKIPIADRSLYFVSLKQLILPSWGYGVPTGAHPFTYQLGWPLLICVLLTILLLFISKKKQSVITPVILMVVWLGYVFMLFSFTAPIWQHLPLLKEINYPWTLLGPIGFVSSLLVGALSSDKYLRYIVLSGVAISIIFFLPYAKPSQFVDRGEGFYTTNTATTTSSQELMPLWVSDYPQSLPPKKVVVEKGKATVSNIIATSKQITANISAQTPSIIRLNTIYYPGWVIKINGKKVPISFANKFGVMQVRVTPGTGNLAAQFTETPDRIVSDVISLLSVLLTFGLLGYGIYELAKNNKH